MPRIVLPFPFVLGSIFVIHDSFAMPLASIHLAYIYAIIERFWLAHFLELWNKRHNYGLGTEFKKRRSPKKNRSASLEPAHLHEF